MPPAASDVSRAEPLEVAVPRLSHGWRKCGNMLLAGASKAKHEEEEEGQKGRIIRRVNADALGHFRKLIRQAAQHTATRQLIAAIFCCCCLDMQKARVN